MTDLTQIERVALAIAKVWRTENKKDDPESLHQAAILFEPSARAAIEAMRTPTDAMDLAGMRLLALNWDMADGRIAPEVWEAMVNEALK